MPIALDDLASTGLIGGRVATLQPDNFESAVSVRVVEAPDVGKLTVNPDNSLALVLTGSDYSGPLRFTVEVEDANGNVEQHTVTTQVSPPTQDAGWGTGSTHYMLETDDNGDLVIETGDNHREVYVSGSNDALSLADIAALENIPVSQVTGAWLAAHPSYGSSPEMALAQDAGDALWIALTQETRDGPSPSSNWLRLEKGYEYDSPVLFPRGITGEDPLHPVVITSYGEGEKPLITGDDVFLYARPFANVVVHELHFTETVRVLGTDAGFTGNVIFDSISSSEHGEIVFQHIDSATLRNAEIHDIKGDRDYDTQDWQGHGHRTTGFFAGDVDGLLIEGSSFSGIGWDEGYQRDGNGNFGQPPTMWTHNVYVTEDNTDLTFRDNISSEASSYGAILRSGGFVEDNLLFENNAGLVVTGGSYRDIGHVGNYSLLSNNVITSAAYKEADFIGALSLGLVNEGLDTTLVNNIVAHLSDPNRPEELDYKLYSNGGLINSEDPYYDDTAIFNWIGARLTETYSDQNVEDLDSAELEQATAANLAKLLLNDPNAEVADLAEWIRQNEDASADELNAFFQAAFDRLPESRGSSTEVRFIPNELGDGVRWDNRMNWSTGDIAGSMAGDSVDLGGNWVVYGGTHTIDGLDFGNAGQLDLHNGRLNVLGATEAGVDGASVEIDLAGQFWLDGGYAGEGDLDIDLDGGRFANTGNITGDVNVFVDDGQALLSADGGDMTFGNGDELTVRGRDAQVGFDGTRNQLGIISFDEDSELVLASDETGLGQIGEFRSGAFGDTTNVNSRIELGGVNLTVDLSDAQIGNGTYTLLSADEITGRIGSIDIQGLGGRGATVIVDYTNDVVSLELGAGSGVTLEYVGVDNSSNEPSTDPGVDETPDEPVVDETPDDPVVDETPDEPVVDETPDDPVVDETPDDPVVDETPDDPVVDETPDDPVVDETPDDPVVDETPDEPVVDETPDDPVVDETPQGPDNAPDAIYAQGGLIFSTKSDDVVYGSANADIIVAGAGNDYVTGGEGRDTLKGGRGNDWLLSGQHGDKIYGGAGRDQIDGGSGDDRLKGGADGDIFVFSGNGSDGADTIVDFEIGLDKLVIGNGTGGFKDIDDVEILDDRGTAVVSDGRTTIRLEGISREDVVTHSSSIFGDGADLIYRDGGTWDITDNPDDAGQTPSDPVVDETPTDPVVDETPDDPVVDEAPTDPVVDETPDDPIVDETPSEPINAPNAIYATGGLIFSTKNDDVVYGSENADIIVSGIGHDYVVGGEGRDTLKGDSGNDWLLSGQHGDKIYGGTGRDQIDGGAGDDRLTGGADGDVFTFSGDGTDGADSIVDFEIGLDKLVIGNEAGGYKDIDDLLIQSDGGMAVISDGDASIRLEGISREDVLAYADSIFGDETDLIYQDVDAWNM